MKTWLLLCVYKLNTASMLYVHWCNVCFSLVTYAGAGGAKFFGVFRVKNHDFTPNNHIFPILGGTRSPWIRPCYVYPLSNVSQDECESWYWMPHLNTFQLYLCGQIRNTRRKYLDTILVNKDAYVWTCISFSDTFF